MKMEKNFKRTAILVWMMVSVFTIVAQNVPQGITYQGIARNSSGNLITSQAISVKLGIYAPSVAGALEWEEIHNVSTNSMGLFYFIIGQGTTTGSGMVSSFSMIDWGAANHEVKISVDQTGGSSYVDIDTVQFWSVPYAMYSGQAATANQPLRINQLADADTIGVATGDVLKWNGSLWVPAPDNNSDTALYAYNSDHSITSDTAMYAVNALSVVDTVLYAYNSGNSNYAVNSNSSLNSGHSDYCDTAVYAFNTGSSYSYWNLTGNGGVTPATNFIGSINSADVIFKTNNAERLRITSAGKIGLGISAPTATLHIVGDDGIVAEGTFGTGVAPPAGAGTRMLWYPKKAAFRAGSINSTQWNDASIGIYSFAANSNNTASGAYSTAFGYGSTAIGQYSFVACQGSVATGISAIAMGTGCNAGGAYSIALGRGAAASDSSAVAIGYHNSATGKYAVSLGYETVASGPYSTVMGFWGSSNGRTGSFVFADYSSSSVTNSTADNQFMVRAAGGTIFYTNAGLTTGVSLPAGGGSWASVSDKNKKAHFRSEDADKVLAEVAKLNITSWNYKTQDPSIRHIGPMAQDFYKAFKFGESDTTITTVDMDGISLLAIQALAKKTEELNKKAAEVNDLQQKIAQLEKEKQLLEKRIVGIEEKLNLAPTVTVLNQIKR